MRPISKGAVLSPRKYQADPDNKVVSIQLYEVTPAGELVFALFCEGYIMATATHPKPLSTYGFAQGARMVRFDFDLNLVDD